MKVCITKDEWCPVFNANPFRPDDLEDWAVEMADADFAEYRAALKAYMAWQKRLREMLDKTRAGRSD